MPSRKNSLIVPYCLLSLFLVVPVWAQDAPVTVPSLNDAKTVAEVTAYVNSEYAKLDLPSLKPEEQAITLANLLIPASEKMLLLATISNEKRMAYNLKMSALVGLVQAEIAGAEKNLLVFLDELETIEEFAEMAEYFRFRYLAMQMMSKEIAATKQALETFLKELETKEKTKLRSEIILNGRFFLFSERAKKTAVSAENFVKFMPELKGWVSHWEQIPITEIAALGFEVAYQNKIPAEQIVRELTETIQSPQFAVPAEEKKELIVALTSTLRLAPGVDPKLYGKTLDDKDFDWASLRRKYVLIKFTATWCGPCKMEIPGMLEAYAKYKNKGLEIVSIYVSERSADPVASVKKFVEEEKLPWLILSEALTVKANQPPHGEFYGIIAVPTIVLVDKEGKIMPLTRGDWKKKLAEVFE